MTTEYHVKLIQTGNTQTLTIPQDLTLSTTDVTIRQEDGKLIIEPYHKKSLLSVLATLEPLDEDFPNVDAGVLPLDDIELLKDAPWCLSTDMNYSYLLDTNIISELVKHPRGQIFTKIQSVGEATICTSIIVACELRFGARKNGGNDLLIAAHALSLNLTVITNNVREFSRVPNLKLENWLNCYS